MRLSFWLPLWAGVLATSLSAASITSTVTNLNTNLFRYTYTVSNFSFQINQELDIRFDPTLYTNLANGTAPANFNVVLLQPNSPQGVPGDFTALSTINNPSLNGQFSVDVNYLGFGTPGPQPFMINQFNSDGQFVSTLESGFVVTPEPSTFGLGALGVLAFLGLRKSGRFSLNRA
jgi:hypothetical protein